MFAVMTRYLTISDELDLGYDLGNDLERLQR